MYQFQHAHGICQAAIVAFGEESPADVHEAQKMIKAARHVDMACGILKKGYDIGSLNDHEYSEIMDHIDEAEALLEDVGVLADHDYLRDDLEERATELLNVDDVDVEDEAEDYEAEDRWLFDRDGDGYED